MKTIQAEIKADQVTWKAEVRQQFERVTEVLNEPRQRNNVNNNAVQAVDPGAQAHSATDQEIVILGGFYGPRGDEVSNTVEIFNVAEGNSVELPPMNTPRAESGSCVYHNDVIVAGGYDGQAGTDSIEIFRMNQRFLQWVAFEGSLPVKLSGHVIIVHQGKLFVIGGYNWNEMKTSDAIYEICLTPPYDSNLLARMPEPRTKHRVELVNGKLFIFGGMTTLSITDAINSVVVYDFITNQVQQYPSLPRPVCGMSTVTCGNMIILVGGMDENGFVLDDVIIYDTATGRKLQLPSMTHKRYGATAVIVRDVIVVFGGWNEEQGYNFF
jgi:N-acetylneuraminic acid mutarotase